MTPYARKVFIRREAAKEASRKRFLTAAKRAVKLRRRKKSLLKYMKGDIS